MNFVINPINMTALTVIALNGTVSDRRFVENKNRKLQEYNLLKIIGFGTYSTVYAAELNGKCYAIKSLNKSKIIE